MKVMVIGDQQGAEAFLAALWGLPDLQLVSFADRPAAEAELARNAEQYDWVLLDGRELCSPQELLGRRAGEASPERERQLLVDGRPTYVYEYHAPWARG